jgi:hypothetical protein
MLNYNLNINSPLQQEKKNEDVRPPINWDFHSFASASDSTDLSERTFATMSINTPNTNCIQVSIDSGNSFTSDAQSQVTASVTGSNWPITGSTTMSLLSIGITYDPLAVDQYISASVSASGTQIIANPSISGSIITNKFLSSEFYRWYVSGSVVHIKGNVFNPLVKVLATGSNSIYSNSQGTNTILNIVKNVNEPISMSIGYITGSQTSSFQYEYAFNITSSLTGSANWPRSASHLYPTMSLSIPEAGINVISYQTASIITASFAANTNTTYTITASIAPRYIPAFTASFYLFAGGAGGASTTDTGNRRPGGGGGAGAMFTGSFNISPNRTYTVVVGAGGAADTSGDTTQFNGFDMGIVEIPITMSLQGGRSGGGMNGGNSGTGSYTIGTTTTQLPLFTGGSGDDGSGGGTLRFAAGGGAGSSQNGVSGIAFPNRVSGRGGNGFVAFGGGGGGGGADRANFSGATRGVGGTTGGGDGGGSDSNQNGFPATAYGAGGGGATSTTQGNSGGSGYQGVLTVSYPGTGSRFTATGNYSLSYSNGVTTYTFNPGSSSFSYVYEPELNPAPLT